VIAGTRAPRYPDRSLVERSLDLVFPPLCVGCRRIGRWICAMCWQRVPWIGEEGTGYRSTSSALADVLAVAAFEDIARAAVHALKYEEKHAISGMMGRLMAETLRERPIDLIAPVSLHPSRRRERGYDQAALLSRGVARALQLPYDSRAVRRVRRTEQQVSLDAARRRDNVRGAFAAGRDLTGLRVVLVDDVLTTGATMEAAAEAARAAGAASVIGAVFASAYHTNRSASNTAIPASSPGQS
jgi:ComF family protein